MTPKIDRNIVTAEHKSEGSNLTSHTIASDDFGTILPIKSQLLQAGDHYNLSVKQFTRLLPLNSPAFGKIENTLRGFLVPLHLVFRGWFDFLKSQPLSDKNGVMGTYRMPFFTTKNFLCHTLLGAYHSDDSEFVPGDSIMGLKLEGGSNRSRKFIKAPYDLADKIINIDPDIFQVRVEVDDLKQTGMEVFRDAIQTPDEEAECLFEINSVYVGYGPSIGGTQKPTYRNKKIFRELYNNNDLVIDNSMFCSCSDIITKTHRCSIGGDAMLDPNVEEEVSRNSQGFNEFLNNIYCVTQENLKFPLRTYVTLTTDSLGNPDSSDICVYAVGLKLTRRGRKLFHLLQGLGYNLELPTLCSWALLYGYDVATQRDVYDWRESYAWRKPHNALFLACWTKFYYDWVIPARWIDTNVYRNMRELFDSWHYDFIGSADNLYDHDVCGHLYAHRHQVNATTFKMMFDVDLFCSSWFVDDYYMSCLPSPWADSSQRSGLQLMLGGNSGSAGMAGAQSLSNGVDFNDDGRVAMTNANFDSYSLQTLGVLTSMLKRGLFNGTKVQDWLINEFGLRPDIEILDCCRYLGHKSGQIMIGDVMAQASSQFGPNGSQGNDLGEYAGQGSFDTFDDRNAKARFVKEIGDVDEASFLIVTHELMPQPMYFQGNRPHTSSINVFDFYTPSFDGVGFDSLTLSDLISTSEGSGFDADNHRRFLENFNEKFGFQPRYTKWKIPYDTLLGDFRINSINTGLDSWYINRKISEIPENVLISPEWQFASEGMPNNDADRIFKNNTQDHFYSIYEITLSGSSKVIPIRKAIRFQESDGRTLSATDGSIE